MSVRSVTPPNEWTRRGVDHCIQNPGEGRAREARVLGRVVQVGLRRDVWSRPGSTRAIYDPRARPRNENFEEKRSTRFSRDLQARSACSRCLEHVPEGSTFPN